MGITNSYHRHSNYNASRTGPRQKMLTVDVSFLINVAFSVFFEFHSIPTCMCVQEREDQEPNTHTDKPPSEMTKEPRYVDYLAIVQYNTKDGKPYQQLTSNNQKQAALTKPPRRKTPTSSTLIGTI